MIEDEYTDKFAEQRNIVLLGTSRLVASTREKERGRKRNPNMNRKFKDANWMP